MTEPVGLRVVHLNEPLGIDVQTARLPCRLPEEARAQRTYRIRAGADGTQVGSNQLVSVSGPMIASEPV